MENLEQVIRLFILLIDVIVVITLLFTLIKGIRKGFFKYLITDGLKWIIILVLIMFSGKIAGMLLNTEYPEIGNLNEYFINLICDQFDLEYSVIEHSYTYDLIYGVVFSTVRLVIIYLTALVVSLIIYPIISLILKIFGVRKLMNNIERGPFVRIAGLVLSAVIFCVYFCITYLPYYGGLNIALKVEKDVEIINNQDVKEIESLENFKLSDYIDASFIYPLFKEDDNIAVKYLNSIYVVEVETKDLYLINEYYIFSECLPDVINYLVEYKKEGKVFPETEAVQSVSSVLKRSDSVEILLPIVVEVAIATDQFEKYEIDITFEELHDVNWHNEKEILNEVFDDINELYEAVYLYQNDLKQIISTEEFVEVTPELVKNIFNLYLFKEYGYDIIQYELEEYAKSNEGLIAELLSLIEIKDLIEKDLSSIVDIIQDLYTLGIFETEGLNLKIENEEQIQSILDKIFNLSFIVGNESMVIESLLTALNISEIIEGIEFDFDNPNINWENEINNLGHLVFIISENPDILENLTELNEETKTTAIDLLQTLVSMDLINQTLPNLISGLIDQSGLEDFKSAWLVEQCENINKDEWNEEIVNLVDFIIIISNTDVDFNNIKDAEISEIHEIMLSAIEIKSITASPIIDILNGELQTYFDNEKTYLEDNDDIDWQSEIDLIFGSQGIYEHFSNLNDNTSYRTYGKLIDLMKESCVFGPNVYEILRDFIKSTSIYKSPENASGILTDEDLTNAVFDQIPSWENELKLLDSIDMNASIQTGETIDILMQSVLLKRHINDYVLEIIQENNLSEYYLPENISQDIDKVNDYIEESKLDSDSSNDYSWSKEVENLTNFSSKLEEIKAGNMTEQSVNELKNIAQKGIITRDIYQKVLEENPFLNNYLN